MRPLMSRRKRFLLGKGTAKKGSCGWKTVLLPGNDEPSCDVSSLRRGYETYGNENNGP